MVSGVNCDLGSQAREDFRCLLSSARPDDSADHSMEELCNQKSWGISTKVNKAINKNKLGFQRVLKNISSHTYLIT